MSQLKLPNSEAPFKTYEDCLMSLMCESQSSDCYFGKCDQCPRSEPLRGTLENLLSENYIDEVTFKQWTQVDRCELQTVVKSADEFIESFVENAPRVLEQHYTAKQQSSTQPCEII